MMRIVACTVVLLVSIAAGMAAAAPGPQTLALRCAIDDPRAFAVRVDMPAGTGEPPSAAVDGCGAAQTARVLGRDGNGVLVIDARTTVKPHGRVRRDGSVVSGRKVTVEHRSRIRHEPFAEPARHVSRGRFAFDVPDVGAATTPVRLTVVRRQKGDPTLMADYTTTSHLQVRNEDHGDLAAVLVDPDGAVDLELVPGPYQLRFEETSAYRAIGPRSRGGWQPRFFRSVEYAVSANVPAPPATAPVPLGADGWTDLTGFLAADARIVYVSAAGDDLLAAQVHGRGYYLPQDPEVGPDPTQPAGAVVAYATLAAARAAQRFNGRIDADPDQPLFPDWLLFRRGEQFELGSQPLVGLHVGGRSADERRVYAAWGPLAEPRPVLRGTPGAFIEHWGSRGGSHLAFVSLEFAYPEDLDRSGLTGAPSRGFGFGYGAANVLIEDVRFPGVSNNTIQSDADDIVVRRSVISGNWNAQAHNQGVFVGGAGDVVFEECVFDKNGYKEDPFRPATWTRGVRADVPDVPGTTPDYGPWPNVQPRRTFYDRNAYLSSYRSLRFRGNIVARGGGGGSVQMRVGGIAERNLLLFNESAITACHNQADRAWLQDALLARNLVLHDDHLLPPGGFGQGLSACAGDRQTAVATGNVVVHFHRVNNAGAMIGGGGIPAYTSQGWPEVKARFVALADNVAVAMRHGGALTLEGVSAPSGVSSGLSSGNAIAVTVAGTAARDGDAVPGAGVSFGAAASDGNRYFAAAASAFQRGATVGTFADWQSAGFDPEGSLYSAIGDLAAAAGWKTVADLTDGQGRNGWERDIVSYMQSIDPGYVADDAVTVDDGVPVADRRPDAALVWQVLHDFVGYPHDGRSGRSRMPEEDARLAARRYHAFLVFIERAKANRRGAWDPRYTADAVNNYIRAGFGKKAVGGPWSGTFPVAVP